MSACELCGEPMPPGEEMFKYHGYSGPCPKPPLPAASAPAGPPTQPETPYLGAGAFDLQAHLSEVEAENRQLSREWYDKTRHVGQLLIEVETLRSALQTTVMTLEAKDILPELCAELRRRAGRGEET